MITNNYLTPKKFEKPNTADKNQLLYIEHPKISHKLSKAIRQAEKIS